jgi:hypothetical protein
MYTSAGLALGAAAQYTATGLATPSGTSGYGLGSQANINAANANYSPSTFVGPQQ